jgi:SM-20-related protein
MPELLLIENFLDEATCRSVLSDLQSGHDAPAPVYGVRSTAAVEHAIRRGSRVAVSEKVRNDVSQRLDASTKLLSEHFGVTLVSHEEPQFLRYRQGDFFVAHQDGNTPLVRDDTRFRKISVIVFLNRQSADPKVETYSGGSLLFHEPFPDHHIRQPFAGAPGTLAAFRSETTHEVIPVTHGERYTVVSWYR